MPAYFTTPLSALTRKWRIFYEVGAQFAPSDEKSDFEELRGYGDTRIYRHGQATLAVSSDMPRVLFHLKRDLPELEAKTGSVLLFPDALLDSVAEAIRARRRKQVSEEERARLRAIGAGTQFQAAQ